MREPGECGRIRWIAISKTPAIYLGLTTSVTTFVSKLLKQ